MSEVGTSLVRGLEEVTDGGIGIGRPAHRVIRQQEFAEAGVVEGLRRMDRRLGEPIAAGISIIAPAIGRPPTGWPVTSPTSSIPGSRRCWT